MKTREKSEPGTPQVPDSPSIESRLAADRPPIVTREQWDAAHASMMAREKAFTRTRDALAAERRRMPWMAVHKPYEFEGPRGKATLLDLFEGRRQLIVYRAFFEPGVYGWPEHACRGCSLGADQVSNLAHLNARDTTLVFASRAPQDDIARLKARMGWKMPWYTLTDSFDVDFGVDQWHGHNVFIRDDDRVFRTYLINSRGDEAMGTTWSYLDATPLGRQEAWEDSPTGYLRTAPYHWWRWNDEYTASAAPDERWIAVAEAGQTWKDPEKSQGSWCTGRP
ncbi:thioredoxin family protein [soil metagenome]